VTPRGAASPGAPLLVRARRRIALLVTGAVLLGVLLAGAVTWLSVMRERDTGTEQALRNTALGADDVTDPPAGISLFILDASGAVTRSSGAPVGLPERSLMQQARTRPGVILRTVHRPEGEYLTATARHDAVVVQAVADLTTRDAEQHRLAVGLGLATLVGLLLALALGRLLANRATAPLAEALARQRRFVADASHELRTPLSRLALRAELLTRELPADSPARTSGDAERLLTDAREMSEVLNDLLLSAQLRGDRRPTDAVDLARLATEVVASDQQRATRGGVTLTLEDPPTGPLQVSGSAPALRRALVALVDNALAHTPSGGAVRVRVGREDGTVRVDVTDTGEGFDPSQLPALLRPFGRGHEDRRRFGLGLALVTDVLEAHDGRLSAHSEPGRGATWTVRLPLRPPTG